MEELVTMKYNTDRVRKNTYLLHTSGL